MFKIIIGLLKNDYWTRRKVMEGTAGLSRSSKDGPWWLDFKRANRCDTIDMGEFIVHGGNKKIKMRRKAAHLDHGNDCINPSRPMRDFLGVKACSVGLPSVCVKSAKANSSCRWPRSIFTISHMYSR
jgi:hypothetical protein